MIGLKAMRFSDPPNANTWALQDPLTGFANPADFLRQLSALGPGKATRRILLVLDIDRYRAIKNSLGYSHSDELLRAVAARLQSALPSKTLIGHLGEDAFAVVVCDIDDESKARALALSLFVVFQSPFTIGGKEVRGKEIRGRATTGKRISISVSIGIATVTADPEVCLRNANTALCCAKDIGPAQIIMYDRAMREGNARWLQLETELRGAVDASKTAMAYQPIVNLLNGQVDGHEALMRWSSKTHGVISPSDFIPMAERAGIAPLLDKWAISQAISHLQRCPQAGFVNVNVSACSLLENSWIDETLARFQASGLRAGQLRLEITETALLNQESTVHANLIRLSRGGLPVILDDFGTGYSSLSHLRLFPIVGIKIDRSFVAQIDGDGREGRIVSAMTRLALDLGMSVTAEGVENELQHTTLIATGCGFAQGYFYGFPRLF